MRLILITLMVVLTTGCMGLQTYPNARAVPKYIEPVQALECRDLAINLKVLKQTREALLVLGEDKSSIAALAVIGDLQQGTMFSKYNLQMKILDVELQRAAVEHVMHLKCN